MRDRGRTIATRQAVAGTRGVASILAITLATVMVDAVGWAMPAPPSSNWMFTGPGAQVIHTLAIDTHAASTLYAGGEGGGIFKTTNGGVSWGVLRHGPAPTTPVYAIVIDSAVPATLYAGTGGQGVLKSTDAGNDWTAVNVGLANLDITALAADSSGTLFAASKVGVFTSTDDGASWSNPSSAPLQADVSALVADPHTPGTLYAATQGSGLFKTTDGGTHWSETDLVNRYVDALAI